MDSMAAFAMATANKGAPVKVFDWDEAARRIKAAGVAEASAGLGQDWEYTGGDILRDGKPIPANETYVYLASNWATPELDLGTGARPCWRLKSETPGWNADTYWPESALAILNGESTP